MESDIVWSEILFNRSLVMTWDGVSGNATCILSSSTTGGTSLVFAAMLGAEV